MSRKRVHSIQFFNLNFKSESRKGKYDTLIKAINEKRQFAKIDDEHLVYIPFLYELNGNYYGWIRRVTKISNYINLNDNTIDDKNIPPDHIKANSIDTLFVLNTEKHIIAYEKRPWFSAEKIRKGLEILFTSVISKDEAFDVFIITDSQEVKRLLAGAKIFSLVFSMTFSNSSITKESEAFEDYLKKKNISKYEVAEKSMPNKPIKIDNNERKMLKLASKEGSYQIKGEDQDGKPMNINSQEHPILIKIEEEGKFWDDKKIALSMLTKINQVIKKLGVIYGQ